MLSNRICALLALVLFTLTLAANAHAQKAMGDVMCACPGASKPLGDAATCEEACFGKRSTNNSAADARARADADARAREEANARAREEAEAAERERVEADRQKKEKEEADANFVRDRDEAAKTLKGSSGNGGSDSFGLKGSSGASDLRDAVAEPGLKGSSPTVRDRSKQAGAWRQVHCAAGVFKHALNAISNESKDYKEYGTLSAYAMKAVDGEKIDVQCEATPDVPTVDGQEVDVEKLKAAQKSIIERADVLVQRMKQTAAAKPAEPKTEPPKPAAAPCTGTKIERMRCAQLRLNDVNSKKIEGTSTKQITEEEKNRTELANLVLINNGIEKGDLTVNTAEEAPVTRRPRRPVPKP